MTNRLKNILTIALLGAALTAASGCTLGTASFMDDYPPGLQNAFGNAGGDNDPSDRSNRGGQGGETQTASNPAGGVGPDENGPGNSGFGRGAHANAGGGNGQELDGEGNDMDPARSGDNPGNSGSND
jgi:hypothetical protein